MAAFILMALVQLFVPAKMIWDREDVLNDGVEHKFKTAPIDPNDPFRGKYITLSYTNNTFETAKEIDFASGSIVYVCFDTDDEGFSKIKSVSDEKPTDNLDYLKTKARVFTINETKKLTIDYPFDRFYMEESKAYDAEIMYRQTQRDTSSTTYALVYLKNGDAVLRDVLINGISIREIVKGMIQ